MNRQVKEAGNYERKSEHPHATADSRRGRTDGSAQIHHRKKSGSEAIKYIVKEYPDSVPLQAGGTGEGELQRKYQDQKIAVGDFLKAFERLQQTMEDDRK